MSSAQAQAQPPAPPSPATVLFARGVIARLSIWPALRIAVANSWGGPSSREKQRWLAGVLVDEFEEPAAAPPAPPPLPAAGSASRTGAPAPAPAPAPPAPAKPQTPDASYLEDLLLQILDDEFDTRLEDDSAASVARDVLRLWNDTHPYPYPYPYPSGPHPASSSSSSSSSSFAGKAPGEDSVLALEAQADRLAGKMPTYTQGAGDNDDDDDWSDDDGSEESDDGEGGEGSGMQVDRFGDGGEAPQLRPKEKEEPEVDEDGFTTVKKKGRR